MVRQHYEDNIYTYTLSITFAQVKNDRNEWALITERSEEQIELDYWREREPHERGKNVGY